MSDDPYQAFKRITDKYYTDWKMPDFSVFEMLLKKYGIRLRNKDGLVVEANFSVPKSVANALVLGMRYIKQDGSFTEDLFLFESGKSITRGYKGELEELLPEYRGTHKLPPNTEADQ